LALCAVAWCADYDGDYHSAVRDVFGNLRDNPEGAKDDEAEPAIHIIGSIPQ